ncbi:MAG: glycogen debranching protein [Acidobacteria bacterium]|nr:glycogen debranching protein [Acidobacteriota bacterium]
MPTREIRFGPDVCADLGRASKLEWIETNGLGGFASSTILGMSTRRYHGLLVAATRPPVGRMVLLSKLEETLIVGAQRFELSVNRYPGTVHPQGHVYLREFRLDPFPAWVYEAGGVRLEKRVFMVDGENSTVIEYQASAACSLELRPLIAFRDYHSTTHANGGLNPALEVEEGAARVEPYAGLPSLWIAHSGGRLEPAGDWYYNFEYDLERERGLDYHEDLFNPFVLRFELPGAAGAALIASTGRRQAADAAALREREIERRRRVTEAAPSPEPLIQKLAAAADQFLVRRGDLWSVIAGYHWFSDWGRDTMIALPGLTLATGRHGIARGILETFANSIDRGMLPNRFPDAGETPEYNTVDATLWFFEAVRSYLKYTGDYRFVQECLYEKLKEIVDWHRRGTRYGIRAGEDGLLYAGEPGVQLTWMDAKVGDWVVTPRSGKPVEIQALWYNALCVLHELAGRFNDTAAEASLGELATLVRASFNTQFWNPETGCLYDVINGQQPRLSFPPGPEGAPEEQSSLDAVNVPSSFSGERDASIRPNQIFVVSLHHSMLAPDKARQVVEVVERDLFTPLGLRSLSPRDPQYRPRYEGGVWERDSAYHQGTVWPWLLGPFITAYVEVHGRTEKARQQAAQWLEAFDQHLSSAGLGQISEIAGAEPPHAPRGCIAQAWSVAELLRAAVEDIYEIRVRRNGHARASGAALKAGPLTATV